MPLFRLRSQLASSKKSCGEASVTLWTCSSLIRSVTAVWCTVEAMMSEDRSTFAMGLVLSWMTASVTGLSKQCVAAMTTCRLACVKGKAPDFVRASRRSKAASLSVFCSALDRSAGQQCLLRALCPPLAGVDDGRPEGMIGVQLLKASVHFNWHLRVVPGA